MVNWKQTFRIDDIFSKRNGECGMEDWTDNTVHELAKEMARRIKRKWPARMIDGNDWDPLLTEVYDWFDHIKTLKEHQEVVNQCMSDPDTTDEEYLEYVKNTPMHEFNQCMDLFYDWCDSNMVWVQK